MFSAVILAGGKGERFGSSVPKPFMSLNGKPVIQYSIDVFEPLVDEIIIVSNTQYKDYKCVKGGKSRSESAYNGVKESTGDYVIIHDGARPFLRPETVEKIKELLLSGCDAVDTISPIIDGFIDNFESVSKQGKCLGLTPEGFKRSVLEQAFKCRDRSWQDEVSMVQDVCGANIEFVEVPSFNSKITYEQDLAYAEGIMKFWTRPVEPKFNLKRKTLIFGGSSGIGKACAEVLDNADCPTRSEMI